jgi:hypothetical protein
MTDDQIGWFRFDWINWRNIEKKYIKILEKICIVKWVFFINKKKWIFLRNFFKKSQSINLIYINNFFYFI